MVAIAVAIIALLSLREASAQSPTEVRDELKAVQRQLADLRVAVADLAGKHESTLRLIDATTKRIDGLQAMMTWALGFLAMLTLAAISGAVSLNTLKLELGIVKTDVAALKADVGALKADVGALKADVGALKTDVAVLTTESAARDGLLKHLSERLGERYPRPGDAT